MAQTNIDTREVVRDILSGVDDIVLMEKYRLSSKGLETLINRLVDTGQLRQPHSIGTNKEERRKISAREIIADITSGMSESELMSKYKLSQSKLQRVCKKLLEARNRTRKEFVEEIPIDQTTLIQANVRQLQRYYPDFDLPIYESSNPEIQGRVRDITEEGVGVVGIESLAYQTKYFVVLGDPFGEVEPFEFVAECRWAQVLGGGGRYCAGFRIVRIERNDLHKLRKLIQLITLTA